MNVTFTLKGREAMGRKEGEEMVLPLPVKLIYWHWFVGKGKESSRAMRRPRPHELRAFFSCTQAEPPPTPEHNKGPNDLQEIKEVSRS